jgi:hypothetical protein
MTERCKLCNGVVTPDRIWRCPTEGCPVERAALFSKIGKVATIAVLAALCAAALVLGI